MRASTKHRFSLSYPWSLAPGLTLTIAYADGSRFAAAILDAWSPADLLKRVVVMTADEIDLIPDWADVARQCSPITRKTPSRTPRFSDPRPTTFQMTQGTYLGTSIRRPRFRAPTLLLDEGAEWQEDEDFDSTINIHGR